MACWYDNQDFGFQKIAQDCISWPFWMVVKYDDSLYLAAESESAQIMLNPGFFLL